MFAETIWDAVASSVLLFLPRVAIALVVLVAFWLLGSGSRRIIQRLGLTRKIDAGMVYLLGETARVTLLVVGVISALGTLGIDVTALVAGLGLTGLALGLAMKDIISNLVSGILVIVYKPFRENDVIAVTTFQGRVQEVNLRFTTLESDDKVIYIPNAMVINNAVVVEKAQTSPDSLGQ